jgi:cardiolipin synthase
VLRRNRTNNTSRNNAELIRGGRGYFDLLKKLINEAEHLIHFQFYIFEPDKTGREIADVLIAAATRGVNVYLLLDAYGSQKLSKSIIEEFKVAGIHFQWFQPFFKSRKFYLGRRLHHKVVVIDSYHSLVSGLNISDRYNDMPGDDAWLDWALHCEGAVSLQLEDICRRRMKLKAYTNHPKSIIKTDTCEIGVRVNDWVGRRQEITRSYLNMLREARSHVVIMTSYFMPGYQFRKGLKAAARRGVKVQMILTGDSDVPVAKYAERFMYDWLFRNNIEIWEYQNNVLHGKIAVADKKWGTVGSYNVNNLSAYASIELNLEVIDKVLVEDMEKRLQDIMKNDCKQITQSVYKNQTNIFIKLLQRMAYNMFRFMLFIFTLRIRHPE